MEITQDAGKDERKAWKEFHDRCTPSSPRDRSGGAERKVQRAWKSQDRKVVCRGKQRRISSSTSTSRREEAALLTLLNKLPGLKEGEGAEEGSSYCENSWKLRGEQRGMPRLKGGNSALLVAQGNSCSLCSRTQFHQKHHFNHVWYVQRVETRHLPSS